MNQKSIVLVTVFLLFLSFPIEIVNSTLTTSSNGESPSYATSSQALNVNYNPVFGVDSVLSLYLPFNEWTGEIIFDRSGHGNDAVSTSTMTTDGGLIFDGYDDYVEVVDNPTLRSESVTWSCWFLLDDLTLSNRFLLWKNQGGHHYGDVQIKQDNDQLSVIFDLGGEYQQLNAVSLVADVWYHLAVVWDKDNDLFGLYIDGVIVDSDNYHGGTDNNAWNFRIGGNGVVNQSIDGTIKEVCVYSGALSAAEVAYLYNSWFETPRVNPSSKYIIGGWVSSNNDSAPLFQPLDIQIYLNNTLVTPLEHTGTYRFVFDSPKEVGTYTYELTADNFVEGEKAFVSVVVDRIVVSECGGSTVFTGDEGLAWFQLKSEFDGQPVTNGTVTLSNGQNAVWNFALARWEYKESLDEEYSSTLTVASVFWNKYGLSTLNPDTKQKEAIINWQQPPWYYPAVVFARQAVIVILEIPPLDWGIIGTVIILVALLKLGILKIKIDDPEYHTGNLKQELDNILKPFNIQNAQEYVILQEVLNKLLEEYISSETTQSLLKRLPQILEQISKQKDDQKN